MGDEELAELERLYRNCCWNAEEFDIAVMPARQEYLVAARAAVPRLIAALREARAENERLKDNNQRLAAENGRIRSRQREALQ